MVVEFSSVMALIAGKYCLASLLFKYLHYNFLNFVHSRVSENKNPSTMNLFQNISPFNKLLEHQQLTVFQFLVHSTVKAKNFMNIIISKIENCMNNKMTLQPFLVLLQQHLLHPHFTMTSTRAAECITAMGQVTS